MSPMDKVLHDIAMGSSASKKATIDASVVAYPFEPKDYGVTPNALKEWAKKAPTS